MCCDPVVKKMRDQNGKPWRGQAWKGPLKQAAGYVKQLKVLSTLKWVSLPVIGPILTGFAANWITSIPLGLIILGSILMAGLIYSFYVRWYIGKMETIGDERFHVEAFKAKRPTEYAIWQQFVVKNDFTFNGLYQFVNIAFNQSGDGGHIDRLVAYTEGQQEQLQQSVQVLSTTIESEAGHWHAGRRAGDCRRMPSLIWLA